MTKKILVSFSLAGAMLLTACGHRELPAMGDYFVQVFHDTPVKFAPDQYAGYSEPGADSIYHLVNGRGTSRTSLLCPIQSRGVLETRISQSI